MEKRCVADKTVMKARRSSHGRSGEKILIEIGSSANLVINFRAKEKLEVKLSGIKAKAKKGRSKGKNWHGVRGGGGGEGREGKGDEREREKKRRGEGADWFMLLQFNFFFLPPLLFPLLMESKVLDVKTVY